MLRKPGGGILSSAHSTSLKIPQYSVPSELETVVNINDESPMSRKSKMYYYVLKALCDAKTVDLSECHYVQLLKLALYLEAYQRNAEMKKRTMFKKTVKKLPITDSHEILFSVHYEDLDEERAWIREGDFVDLTDAKTYAKYYLRVVKIEKDDIIASDEAARLSADYVPENLYNINFRFENYPLRCSHYALWFAYKENVITYLFPYKSKPYNTIGNPIYEELTMLNPNIETNPEQKQAVLNILNKSAFPAPYILYGPPGTGKTATLIEAICQIHKTFPSNRILVCTPSNTAADEVARRLLKFIDPSVLYRIYSQSRDKSTVDKELQNCCYCGGGKKIPLRREDIAGKSILISTLCTAIRFVQMQLNADYFSHIIIDEASQDTEPNLLIPISIASKDGQLHSQIVFSGDPQQLGPTVISELAKIVFGRSILERLMTYDTYRKNCFNEYDPKYITKLLHNYRSHPSIIRISNELFYDNELIPKFSSYDHNVRFPVIFHGVDGVEEKNSYSPSSFNYEEIRMVMTYVYKLLENRTELGQVAAKDIGIVTPFKLQKKKIRRILEKKDAQERRMRKKESLKNVKLLKAGETCKLKSEDLNDDESDNESLDVDSEEDKDVVESEKENDELDLGSNEKIENEGDESNGKDIQKNLKNFKDINVGTVELFQGQERKIMIMTAVRSKTVMCNGKENVGFVSNPKRFNVAMTRAQNALIVIGNPGILQKNDMWHYLLKYCSENGSYRGLRYDLRSSTTEKPISSGFENVTPTKSLFKETPFKLFSLMDGFDSSEDILKTIDLFVPPDKAELEKRANEQMLFETLLKSLDTKYF